MSEFVREALKADPITLALIAIVILITGANFKGVKTSSNKVLTKIVAVETKLDQHLIEAIPSIAEHKTFHAEIAALKEEQKDRKKLMLAVSKIAAKLDVEVDL